MTNTIPQSTPEVPSLTPQDINALAFDMEALMVKEEE